VYAISANSPIHKLHTESIAKKSCTYNEDYTSISHIEQSFVSSQKLLLHTSAENNYCDKDV